MVSPLGKLFGKSPIAPIQQHMQLAEETVQLLCELLAASTDGDWIRVADIHDLIGASALEARKLRRELRRELPRGLWLAMPRPDLLELLDIQERLVDSVNAVAHPITLRDTQFPTPLQKPVYRLCNLLAEAAGQALAAIRELDEIIEEGFGNHERSRVRKMLTALDRLVTRCDREQQKLFEQICKHESSFPAVDVMFYYQICTALGALAACCVEVGEHLDMLLS